MKRLALAALMAAALPAAATAATARFAVLAGSNVGAPARATLHYAEVDAERFQKALRELGDFPADHVAVVKSGSADDFRNALGGMERKIGASHLAGDRALLIVYFSGHAGVGGLEFAGERISYDELKMLAGRSGAEAKVVIVDACEAGALTQVKGARADASVAFALPSDDVAGTAFIASTAVGEAAQESAALGGSFFTHHLEVGLRGAADADGDGQVTLAEAFRYTASQTLSGTSATVVGPQHPTYDFRMSGRGDVVLADLRRGEAHLTLPPDPGSLYILKGPRGLFAEVPTTPTGFSLALPAGHYAVERRSRDGRATAELNLALGENLLLPRLSPSRYEMARSKGGPMPTEWFAGFGVATVGLPGFGAAPAFRAGFRREVGQLALRFHGDYVFKDVVDATGGLSKSYGYSRVGGGAALLTPVVGSKYLLEAGVDIGYGYAQQSWRDGQHHAAGDVTAGLALVASVPVARMRLAFDGMVGGSAFKLNNVTTVKPVAILSVVLLYGF
jgi:caspase domain-containing protein